MANLYVTPSEMHRAKVEYNTKIPRSRIYEYTYGYSMNYYQPMIDYLDKRDSGISREDLELPHLPWTNERYIEKYEPKKPIKSYDSAASDEMAKKSQKGALKNINNFDVKRSYFGALPTADATKLMRKLPKKSALEAVYRKDVGKIIQDVKDLEVDAYYRYKDGERLLLEEENETFPTDLRRAIKGKTANQIGNILLANSAKNVREAKEQDACNFRQSHPFARTRRAGRDSSLDNEKSHLEDKLEALEAAKKEFSSFTNKTENYLHDTRYRLHLINSTLREQEDYLMSRKLERARVK